MDALSWEQFETCVYSLGLRFLLDQYKTECEEKLFAGNSQANRVTSDAFMNFLEEMTTFKYTPDEYEKSMKVFDDDHNGQGSIEDMIRVMRKYGRDGEDKDITDEELNVLV